jgi:hypothetical protein
MKAGTLHRIAREWSGRTELAIRFPMPARVTTRYNDALAIERGPLVYSLELGEQWTQVNADKPHRQLPHGDFEVKPTTPWNYGLIASGDGVADLRFEERPVGERPFSPDGAGMAATQGAADSNWRIVRAGGAVPGRRHGGSGPGPTRTGRDVTLIPYGCTNIGSRVSKLGEVVRGSF